MNFVQAKCVRSELCRHLEVVLQVWCVLHVDAEGKGRGSCSRICLYWECLVTVFVLWQRTLCAGGADGCGVPWSEEKAEEPTLELLCGFLEDTPGICWGPKYSVLYWEKGGCVNNTGGTLDTARHRATLFHGKKIHICSALNMFSCLVMRQKNCTSWL